MADNIAPEAQVAEPVVDQQASFKAELDRNMQIAFSGIVPRDEAQPAGNSGAEPVQPTVQEPAAPVVVSDSFSVFKEKFGYENPDAAIKEIEQLRALKEQPEFQFENEDSVALFKAFQAGKAEDVYNFLHSQRQIESLLNKDVDKDSAADIVKLGMQLKYKDLTTEEINYQFNKQFAIAPKPVQEADEEDTDYQNRVAGWEGQVRDKTFELTIAAKQYKPELAAAKKQFVLPKIEDSVDEGYLQYKKMLEEEAKAPEQQKVIEAAYKAMTPKQIETKMNFIDETNKINFDFQYEPDSVGFSKTVEMACDFNQFWAQFNNADGTPNRAKFLDVMYFAFNKDKVLMEAMNQAKNATIKSMLPNNNPDNRQPPTLAEPSELDTSMKRALKGYGTFQ